MHLKEIKKFNTKLNMIDSNNNDSDEQLFLRLNGVRAWRELKRSDSFLELLVANAVNSFEYFTGMFDESKS